MLVKPRKSPNVFSSGWEARERRSAIVPSAKSGRFGVRRTGTIASHAFAIAVKKTSLTETFIFFALEAIESINPSGA